MRVSQKLVIEQISLHFTNKLVLARKISKSNNETDRFNKRARAVVPILI